jgi:hypothetical protein
LFYFSAYLVNLLAPLLSKGKQFATVNAADVAFAGLVGRQAAIGEDEAGHAVGREVVDGIWLIASVAYIFFVV